MGRKYSLYIGAACAKGLLLLAIMKVFEIMHLLHQWAPLPLQESYDNSGLLAGDPQADIAAVLLSLDCTEDVVEEAIRLKCGLIIAHHPILFKPLKSLTGSNYVERTLIKALKNNIAIAAIHTNLDNVLHGVNREIAQRLGLENLRILRPAKGALSKLVTYVPQSHTEIVKEALFGAGAGKIGLYDSCSFTTEGIGTYRPLEGSNPFIGQLGSLHREPEHRVEVVFASVYKPQILHALQAAHPYEEVAFEVYRTENIHPEIGAGITGTLPVAAAIETFIKQVKTAFNCRVIRYAGSGITQVKKVAICGGSGSFLTPDALIWGADVFVSADFKYHEFFEAENKMVLMDVGHFESEQFTPHIIGNFLKEKIPTFAVHFSQINTNPVQYHF
jgi:dinuclear metal center YbgI/SA1388 family protein